MDGLNRGGDNRVLEGKRSRKKCGRRMAFVEVDVIKEFYYNNNSVVQYIISSINISMIVGFLRTDLFRSGRQTDLLVRISSTQFCISTSLFQTFAWLVEDEDWLLLRLIADCATLLLLGNCFVNLNSLQLFQGKIESNVCSGFTNPSDWQSTNKE